MGSILMIAFNGHPILYRSISRDVGYPLHPYCFLLVHLKTNAITETITSMKKKKNKNNNAMNIYVARSWIVSQTKETENEKWFWRLNGAQTKWTDHSSNQTYHTVYTEIYSIEKVFKTKIREEKKKPQQNNSTLYTTHRIEKLNERWREVKKKAPRNN